MRRKRNAGLTLVELIVAMAVFATIASLALSLLVQTDKIALRGQKRLGQTLDLLAIQEKLRNDIWNATDLHIAPDGAIARFTLADGESVTYTVSTGATTRSTGGTIQTFPGVLEFSRAERGVVAVVGNHPHEWGFAARMRNQKTGDAQ